MNYAALVNGPVLNNNNINRNSINYSRMGYPSNSYAPQKEIMGQPSQMIQQQQQQQPVSGGTSQTMNIYQQFPPNPVMKDPRVNIHIGSKLFVGQVPAMTTEEQLRPVFEPYGQLLEVKIMRDPLGRSKGSAWVRYETNEMSMNAINALHEKHTVPPQTNPLRVQFATPKNARQQQQLQSQQQAPVEIRASMNPYNFSAPIGGNPQHNGMIMVRSGGSSNIIPPISPNNTNNNINRYMSPNFTGSMNPPTVISGPYTSSANRFDNTNYPGNRRSLYSPLEQPQNTSTQLYQQQQQQQQQSSGFSSPLTSPNNLYNQQSLTQQLPNRNNTNNNGKNTVSVSVGSFDTVYDVANSNNNNNNDSPTIAVDLSSPLDSSIGIWESRNNNNNNNRGAQGQEQRETGTRIRVVERKDE